MEIKWTPGEDGITRVLEIAPQDNSKTSIALVIEESLGDAGKTVYKEAFNDAKGVKIILPRG